MLTHCIKEADPRPKISPKASGRRNLIPFPVSLKAEHP